MVRLLARLAIGVGIGAWVLSSVAAAQMSPYSSPYNNPYNNSYRPPGWIQGQVQSVYRGSIGEGYSISDINRVTLRDSTGGLLNGSQLPTSIGSGDLGLSSSGGGVDKPFSNYTPPPTVSPYLNLFNNGPNSNSDLNYQLLVKPQLQQQQFNQRIQQRSIDTQRRMQALASRNAYNPQGDVNEPPTGHQTVFMYYGHYYPAAAQRRR